MDRAALPSAAPLGVYGLWGSVTPRRGRFLMGDRLVAEAQVTICPDLPQAPLISPDGRPTVVCAAQDAMGQQCLRDIAISTAGSDGKAAVSTSNAVTPSLPSERTLLMDGGRSYKVRELP